MRTALTLLIGTIRRVGRSRRDLVLENLALRHQLAMCDRRPSVTNADWLLWTQLRRWWSGWRRALVVLEPATVVRRHRAGWRRYGTWKSGRHRPGRRRIPAEARELILRLARENPRWGAVRIRGGCGPSGTTAARRRCAATASRRARRLGIETVLTPVRAPQANAVAERWVGTLRRECLDHVIPLSARHLRRVVAEYVTYYNATRPHRTPALASPAGPRPIERDGPVTAVPVLGGLHHRYERRAA